MRTLWASMSGMKPAITCGLWWNCAQVGSPNPNPQVSSPNPNPQVRPTLSQCHAICTFVKKQHPPTKKQKKKNNNKPPQKPRGHMQYTNMYDYVKGGLAQAEQPGNFMAQSEQPGISWLSLNSQGFHGSV